MKHHKQHSTGAVLYVRVSTDEQASDPRNLQNQEERCKEYCVQQRLSVIAVFVEPGASARSAARPEFQRMLRFCMEHRREVGYVVVQDLSRLARNLRDQAQTIHDLREIGVLVRSTYECNIDETSAGKLAANIFGTVNQYFSDSLSEKMRDRSRQAAAAGRFPWRAPIGYRNIGGKQGANIEPHADLAPLIRLAFEMVGTGLHKKTEVLKAITEQGFRTASGKPLTPQTFQAVLRNPLYAGWVTLPSDKDFTPVRGLHEPIVTQELFDRVQAVLDGKKPSIAPKRKFNPALPLKNFVRCAACGTPLTGGFAQGRTKKYPRYWCRKAGCRAVKLSSGQLETEFVRFLRLLCPNSIAKAQFPKIAEKVWANRQGNAERRTRQLRTRLEDKQRLKRELLTAKLRGEVSQPDYEDANEAYSAEIVALEEELQAASSSRNLKDAFIRFSELQLIDIAHVWQMAGPEPRQRVQNLLFQDGLLYSQNSGILNRSNLCLFNVLEGINDEKMLLASPTGFEPVLPP